MPIAQSGGGRTVNYPPTVKKSYSTTFSGTENPISESGVWAARGGVEGIVWTSPQTSSGIATGTQVPHSSPPYDDSIACLSGYGPNQSCSGVLFNSSGVLKECELFVHQTIAANVATGFELDFLADGRILLVRWNGARNDFTPLTTASNTGTSTVSGAIYRLQWLNGIITAYCDSVSPTTALITYDATGDALALQTGNPGLGFFASTDNGTPSGVFGWDSYSATEL